MLGGEARDGADTRMMPLQDGHPHLGGLHRSSLEGLEAFLQAGSCLRGFEQRVDVNPSAFRCFITLPTLNHNFPVKEGMLGEVSYNWENSFGSKSISMKRNLLKSKIIYTHTDIYIIFLIGKNKTLVLEEGSAFSRSLLWSLPGGCDAQQNWGFLVLGL